MKLVDILARELKEWPEGAHSVDQSVVDKEVYAYDEDEMLGQTKIFLSVTAEDPHTMITRAQWQAAVDALKAGEQDWDGEWKPPVGTVCEVPDGPDYRQATIIAYYKDMAVFAFDDIDGHPYVETCLPLECRRIRTAEQIAAEEREKAISQMAVTALDGDNSLIVNKWLERLYDAGYRKQVQP